MLVYKFKESDDIEETLKVKLVNGHGVLVFVNDDGGQKSD